MPDGRVLIASGDPLDPSPSWSRVDSVDSLVRSIEITTGKQSEFDRTDTGHAVISLNDRTGDYDSFVGSQVLIQLRNPVDGIWYSRFRGLIDEYGWNIRPSQVLADVQISCVDIFDYLAGVEQLPGVHGDPPPLPSIIFWEDGEVDARIEALLGVAGAGLDPDRFVVFSGNVNVQPTKYDPGDSILVALRDAADAESPVALANIYVDRLGRFVFHGRQARIDPDTVSSGADWDFNRWKIGDGAAIAGDSDYAQMRSPFQYRVSRNKVVNAALITPRGVDRATIPTLIEADPTSIAANGYHSYSYADSINNGHKTNGDTASEDLQRSAAYLVGNYKDLRRRIEALHVKAIRPADSRATPVWDVLCKSDISDQVNLTATYPGGGPIDETYNIEGWTQTITPLNPEHDMVDLELNVSPTTSYNPYDDA